MTTIDSTTNIHVPNLSDNRETTNAVNDTLKEVLTDKCESTKADNGTFTEVLTDNREIVKVISDTQEIVIVDKKSDIDTWILKDSMLYYNNIVIDDMAKLHLVNHEMYGPGFITSDPSLYTKIIENNKEIRRKITNNMNYQTKISKDNDFCITYSEKSPYFEVYQIDSHGPKYSFTLKRNTSQKYISDFMPLCEFIQKDNNTYIIFNSVTGIVSIIDATNGNIISSDDLNGDFYIDENRITHTRYIAEYITINNNYFAINIITSDYMDKFQTTYQLLYNVDEFLRTHNYKAICTKKSFNCGSPYFEDNDIDLPAYTDTHITFPQIDPKIKFGLDNYYINYRTIADIIDNKLHLLQARDLFNEKPNIFTSILDGKQYQGLDVSIDNKDKIKQFMSDISSNSNNLYLECKGESVQYDDDGCNELDILLSIDISTLNDMNIAALITKKLYSNSGFVEISTNQTDETKKVADTITTTLDKSYKGVERITSSSIDFKVKFKVNTPTNYYYITMKFYLKFDVDPLDETKYIYDGKSPLKIDITC